MAATGTLLEHHVARHHADTEAVHSSADSVQFLIIGRAITGLSAFA